MACVSCSYEGTGMNGDSVLSYTQQAHMAPCPIPLPLGTHPEERWGEGCRLGALGELGRGAGGRPCLGDTQSSSCCWRGTPGHSTKPCPAGGAAAPSTWEVQRHTSQRAVTRSSCDTRAHVLGSCTQSQDQPFLSFLSHSIFHPSVIPE